ncbi:hypothetical protein VP2p46 [Vibrio phage VP2]|uniref:hypothetical protein n=1 Tax=Vibrio phage VP2 TaxID=260372 RepID=UPI00003CEC46|nr:hypothetical protein VP2p46 [Vibrio phage VP2]
MGAKWGRRPMPRGRTRIFRQSLRLESKTLSRMRNVQRVPMSTVRRYRFFPAFSTSRRYLQILIFLEMDTVDTVDRRPSDGGSRPVQLLAACPPCPVQYGGSVHRVHRVPPSAISVGCPETFFGHLSCPENCGRDTPQDGI